MIGTAVQEQVGGRFVRYCGVDYSGARSSVRGLRGLRVFLADAGDSPREIRPEVDARRHWSRARLAEWLVALLSEPRPTIVGIDHAFSFPDEYFERHRLGGDWPGFLADFQRHWPTDVDGVSVRDVRSGRVGAGQRRLGHAGWRRRTDRLACGKSAFHFDVPGSVAHSTHAGLPWLLRIRDACPEVHFWPFDGWIPPPGRSVIVEVYPRLWNRHWAASGRSADQHDAWCVARWLQQTDREGRIEEWFNPRLPAADRELALREGWMLGVTTDTCDGGR